MVTSLPQETSLARWVPPYKTNPGMFSRARAKWRAAGIGFVASHHTNHCVKHLPAANQFDGIGNQFAAYQGCAHPLGAHGFAIADGDGVEFHWRPTGSANPFLHLGRHPAQVKVAGHGFNPGIGNADQWLGQIAVSKSNGFEHGARRCLVASVGDKSASMFQIHRLRDYAREDRNACGNNT